MHHRSSAILLVLTAALATMLSGCLGKNSAINGNGGVKTVSLSPTGNLSIDVGATQPFSATATDAQGHAIIGTITFLVEGCSEPSPGTITCGGSGPAPISITSAGSACAGNWDQTLTLCTPGTPGIARVSAAVNGVKSSPATVYVHYHIDSLQAASAQQTPPQYDCFSQGQQWTYQALAFNNNVDITSTVGPLNWLSTNNGVLSEATQITVPSLNPNQVQITAESPGVTQIYAGVSGTASNTIPVATCLVQYIRLQAAGSTTNSITVKNGSSLTLEASVVDTLGNIISKPPLTWSTTNPEVVSFSTLTNTTGSNSATVHNNLGGATVTASCTPPTCNIGVLPNVTIPTTTPPYSMVDPSATPVYVYASNGPLSPINPEQGFAAIAVDVTASKPPSYTGWAATDQCQGASGCTSVMYGIDPSNTTNPLTSIITIPRTPNSMMFNNGSRVYMGSDQGLMYVDIGGSSTTATLVSNASTPCNVALCGKVLAISNDGKLVVVGDEVSPTPQAYIYNSSSNAITDLVLSGVPKVAAFSPDQSKIFFITDGGTMHVYSTVQPLGVIPVPASPVATALSADGSFAYVANGTTPPSVTAFSMCSPTPSEVTHNMGSAFPAPASTPLQLTLSPVTQVVPFGSDLLTEENLFALEPPYVQILTAQYKQVPLADTKPGGQSQYFCNAPEFDKKLDGTITFAAGPTYDLAQGAFTPIYSRLVADGSQMIIVGQNIPAVLVFSVSGGTTTPISLARPGYSTTYPLSASSSSDGSYVYVAACDQYQNNDPTPPSPCLAGSVHVVSTTIQTGHPYGDFLQVPFVNNLVTNMCNNQGSSPPLCIADMVAIKPQ